MLRPMQCRSEFPHVFILQIEGLGYYNDLRTVINPSDPSIVSPIIPKVLQTLWRIVACSALRWRSHDIESGSLCCRNA